ncbi:unnamed protein product, partial [Meganyctiphanes norvegica]
ELQNMPYRRNSWPVFVQMSEQASLERILSCDGNNDKLSTRIKNFMIKTKYLLKEFAENTRDKIKLKLSSVLKKLSPVIQFLPVLFSVMALILALTDVATDAVSAHHICTLPCSCQHTSYGTCDTPFGHCRGGIINGTQALEHCGGRYITLEECRRKGTWPVPDTCQCIWN